MADISINKTTGISLGLLLVLLPAAFLGISSYTRLQTQSERNTSDISTIIAKIDVLNTNLTKTNENIITLNARLDGLIDKKNAPTVSVAPARTPAKIVVVRGTAMQPNGQEQQNGVQPGPAPPQSEPEPQEQEPTPVLSIVPQAIKDVLEALR